MDEGNCILLYSSIYIAPLNGRGPTQVVFINCVGSKPSVNSFRPQSPLSWSTASLSPGLTTATAYWRVCRFASWIGYNRCLMLLHVLYGRTPSDHVTDLLRDNLHWLRVPQRITYKLCLITYKAIHNSMPDYITDFCISAADNRLRSSAKNLLQVQRSSRSLAAVPSLSQDPLRGTASQIM